MADETDPKKTMASFRLDAALLDRLTAEWRERLRSTPSDRALPSKVDLVTEALDAYLSKAERRREKAQASS